MKYLLFLLVGCSTLRPGQRNDYFELYLKEYQYHYGKEIPYIPIHLYYVHKAGYCHTVGLSKWIEVSIKYWERSDELQKRSLLFHELGHCHLNRDDEKSKMKGGCPKSLMYFTDISSYCLKKHYKYYMKELFRSE